MLKNTFSHIPGIGKEIEQIIWQSDILSWDEFKAKHQKLNLSEIKKETILKFIEDSIIAEKEKNHIYFAENLSDNNYWRAYPEFKEKCCFLDIETTGTDKKLDDITIIGAYDGKKTNFFINGKNLQEFPSYINNYGMIVTFNGTNFDIPFIQSKFPNLIFNQMHIDLRYSLRELGYSGGLKLIEKKLGIRRDYDIEQIDGSYAVRLWHLYKKGNEDALNLLIKYNQADIQNLKTLMDFAYQKLKEKHFLSNI